MQNEGMEKFEVRVDPDLKDLAAGYLQNRRRDVETLRASLKVVDYSTLRDIGHGMKGSGGSYGFDRITELGGGLEQAAKDRNPELLSSLTQELSDYLDGIVLVFA